MLNSNKIVTNYEWENNAIVKIVPSNVGLIEKKHPWIYVDFRILFAVPNEKHRLINLYYFIGWDFDIKVTPLTTKRLNQKGRRLTSFYVVASSCSNSVGPGLRRRFYRVPRLL